MSLPRIDESITIEDIEKLGAEFLAVGYRYWEMMNKTRHLGGAIVWLTDTADGMVMFTRGEYKDTLLHNVDRIGTVHQFGSAKDD